ncbi:MAG: hypothetical protein R6X11_01210, partial [Desulfonatronovibrio sp.]
MKILCWKHAVFCLMFIFLLIAPASALAYGGGGDGGSGGGGGGGDLSLSEWDVIFTDPDSVDEFGISEGTID